MKEIAMSTDHKKTWLGDELSDRRVSSLNMARRSLVGKQTKAESVLSRILSGFTVRNRRNHPMWFTPQKQFNVADSISFFADFYFKGAKLVVEIDGSHHHSGETKQYDEWRTRVLSEMGVSVVRFDNDMVLDDGYSVCREIIKWMLGNCASPHRSRLVKHLALVLKERPKFMEMIFPGASATGDVRKVILTSDAH